MTYLPQPRIWLKQPTGIFTANTLDATEGIVIQGDKIVELVPRGQHPQHAFDSVVDCSRLVITPGLINTHHHFYQTLTRSMPGALNKPLFPWLQYLYTIWANLDAEMLRVATRLAATELMLSGTTTVGDHHYVFPEHLKHAIDIQVEEIRQLGCRAVLTRGSMSLGQSQGGLPPDHIVQTPDTIIDDSTRLIDQYHERDEGAQIQIALAPCSPFSVSTDLMQQTAVLAKQKGVLIHTHLAETKDENEFCERIYGMRPLDYLDDCGWISANMWLAHGIHFNDEEVKRLGQAKVGIAHCPSSNMLLSSGICRTVELEEAGCHIALAVDGSASNDCSNMIQEVRQSLLQQRLRYPANEITAERVLGWGTKGGANLYQRSDIGEIAVGKQADFAFFSLDEMRFSGVGDPVAGLVTSGAHCVEKLMVGGQWLIEDGQHYAQLQQDLLQLHAKAAKLLQSM